MAMGSMNKNLLGKLILVGLLCGNIVGMARVEAGDPITITIRQNGTVDHQDYVGKNYSYCGINSNAGNVDFGDNNVVAILTEQGLSNNGGVYGIFARTHNVNGNLIDSIVVDNAGTGASVASYGIFCGNGSNSSITFSGENSLIKATAKNGIAYAIRSTGNFLSVSSIYEGHPLDIVGDVASLNGGIVSLSNVAIVGSLVEAKTEDQKEFGQISLSKTASVEGAVTLHHDLTTSTGDNITLGDGGAGHVISITGGVSVGENSTLTLNGVENSSVSGSVTNNGILSISNVSVGGDITNKGTLNIAAAHLSNDVINTNGKVNLGEGTLQQTVTGGSIALSGNVNTVGTNFVDNIGVDVAANTLTISDGNLDVAVTGTGKIEFDGTTVVSKTIGIAIDNDGTLTLQQRYENETAVDNDGTLNVTAENLGANVVNTANGKVNLGAGTLQQTITGGSIALTGNVNTVGTRFVDNIGVEVAANTLIISDGNLDVAVTGTGKVEFDGTTVASKNIGVAIDNDGTLTLQQRYENETAIDNDGTLVITASNLKADVDNENGRVELGGDALTQTISKGVLKITGDVSADVVDLRTTQGITNENRKLTLTGNSALQDNISGAGTTVIAGNISSNRIIANRVEVSEGAEFTNIGTVNNTLSNSGTFNISTGTVTGTVINNSNGTMNGAVTNLNGGIENNGTFNMSGDLIKSIGGTGVIVLQNDVEAITKNVVIDGTLDGNGKTIDMQDAGHVAGDVLTVGALAGITKLQIDVDLSNSSSDSINVTKGSGAGDNAVLNLTNINIIKDIQPVTHDPAQAGDPEIILEAKGVFAYLTGHTENIDYQLNGAKAEITSENGNVVKTATNKYIYSFELGDAGRLNYTGKASNVTFSNFINGELDGAVTLSLTRGMADGSGAMVKDLNINLNGNELGTEGSSALAAIGTNTLNLNGGGAEGTVHTSWSLDQGGTLNVAGKIKQIGSVIGAGTLINTGVLTICADKLGVDTNNTGGKINLGTGKLTKVITGGEVFLAGDVSAVNGGNFVDISKLDVAANTLTISDGNLNVAVTGTGKVEFDGTTVASNNIGVTIDNDGTLTLQQRYENTTAIDNDGTLNVTAENLGANVANTANGKVNLGEGTLQQTIIGGSIALTGNVNTVGTNFVNNIGVDVAANTLTISDGNLDVAVTGTGKIEFDGTTVASKNIGVAIDNNGTLTLNQRYENTTAIDNDGTLVVTGSNLKADVDNENGTVKLGGDALTQTISKGVLKITGDVSADVADLRTTQGITNENRKLTLTGNSALQDNISGAGTTVIAGNITSEKTISNNVEVDTGAEFTNTGEISGTITNSGVLNLRSEYNNGTAIDNKATGVLRVSATNLQADVTNAGEVIVNGAANDTLEQKITGGNVTINNVQFNSGNLASVADFVANDAVYNFTATLDGANISVDQIDLSGKATGTLTLGVVTLAGSSSYTDWHTGVSQKVQYLSQIDSDTTITISNSCQATSSGYVYKFEQAMKDEENVDYGYMSVSKSACYSLKDIVSAKNVTAGDIDTYLLVSDYAETEDLGVLTSAQAEAGRTLTLAGNNHDFCGEGHKGITLDKVGDILNLQDIATISDWADEGVVVNNRGTVNISGITTLDSKLAGAGNYNLHSDSILTVADVSNLAMNKIDNAGVLDLGSGELVTIVDGGEVNIKGDVVTSGDNLVNGEIKVVNQLTLTSGAVTVAGRDSYKLNDSTSIGVNGTLVIDDVAVVKTTSEEIFDAGLVAMLDPEGYAASEDKEHSDQAKQFTEANAGIVATDFSDKVKESLQFKAGNVYLSDAYYTLEYVKSAKNVLRGVGTTNLIMYGSLVSYTVPGAVPKNITTVDSLDEKAYENITFDQVTAVTVNGSLLVGSDGVLTQAGAVDAVRRVMNITIRDTSANSLSVNQLQLQQKQETDEFDGVIITNNKIVTVGGSQEAGQTTELMIVADSAGTQLDNPLKVVVGLDGEMASKLNVVKTGILNIGNENAQSSNDYHLDGSLEINPESRVQVTGQTEISQSITLNGGSLLVNDGSRVITPEVVVNNTENQDGVVVGEMVTESLSIKAGTLQVGSDIASGRISAKEIVLEGKVIFLDPAWMGDDEITGASTMATGTTKLDGSYIAGRNSAIAFGTLDNSLIATVFATSGLEWGENNVTGAVLLKTSVDVSEGGIMVKGDQTISPGVQAAGSVQFFDQSLLMVEGNICRTPASAAIVGVSSVAVAESAKLFIAGADVGEYYILASDSKGITGGWLGVNVLVNEALRVISAEPVEDNSYYKVILGTKSPDFFAKTVASNALAGMNDGVGTKAHEYIMELTDPELGLTEEAKINETNRNANMPEELGVMHDHFSVSNMVEDGVVRHLALDEGTQGKEVWAQAIRSKENVSGLGLRAQGNKYDSQHNGAIVGLDFVGGGKTTWGVALTYIDGKATAAFGSHNEGKYYGASLYGRSMIGKNAAVQYDISYIHSSNDLTLGSSVGLATITGEQKVNSFSAGARLEQELRAGHSVSFVPHVGARWLCMKGESFRNNLGNNYDPAIARTIIVPLGMSFKASMENSGWEMSILADGGYQWNWGDHHYSQRFSYDVRGDSFDVAFIDRGSWYAGIGLEFAKKNFTSSLGYRYVRSESTRQNKWHANLSYIF